MYIVWKGAGILSPILTIGLGLVCKWIFKTETSFNIGLLIGGVLLFLIGIAASVSSKNENEQGKKVNFFRHTFFFLPMSLWGVVALAGAIYLLTR